MESFDPARALAWARKVLADGRAGIGETDRPGWG
jgi:hypothetical protein